jgi:hypothetical protein
VTISNKTAGAVIHYTTDGTTPTVTSAVYNGSITIPSAPVTKTISAIAVASGKSSPVMTAVYTIAPQLAMPSFAPATATYSGSTQVTISSPTPGGIIYYTTNGTQPTASSSVWTGPMTVSETSSIIAVVSGVPGFSQSQPVRGTYTIVQPTPTPIITPGSGNYSSAQTVAISNPSTVSRIFYTTDGTTPTTVSAVYTAPFLLNPSKSGPRTIHAMAIATGHPQSAIATATLNLSLPEGIIATAVVGSTPSRSIPSDFLGVSHAWNDAQTMMGSTSQGRNQLYTTLMRQLTHNMNGPLVIRVGGGNTDTSGAATASTVEPFAELASELPVKFILGVNLGADNLSLAEEQASTFLSSMPSTSLDALEIGNEPDQYSSDGLRPSTYSFSSFLPQYQQWREGILHFGSVPIAGPTFSTANWIPNAETALANGTLEANIVTQHHYIVCYNPINPAPSNLLLQPSSAVTGLYSMSPYVTAAHAAHSRFRAGEINSLCMGGQPGLSNSFSSALWAVDTMFQYVNAGIDGVNWNTSYEGGAYDLFQFHIWLNKGVNLYYLGTVRPLFYGLLFFSRAAGNGASILPVSTVTDSNLTVWATTDSSGKAHVTIINKELTTSGNVQFTLPGFSHGAVTRLSAPGGYLALNGVTFGGQTYDNSTDGRLQGSLVTESITPSGNIWTVSVQPASAVLVDLVP